MTQPRGILPTYVTDGELVLCKASPRIRDAYEIRLALYFAETSERVFVLAVPGEAVVDADVEAHVAQHGGRVVRGAIRDYSVYLGAFGSDGKEIDGWVLGDNDRWFSFLNSSKSSWWRQNLKLGAALVEAQLDRLASEVGSAFIAGTNIDGEPLSNALPILVTEAKKHGGMLCIQ